MLGIQSMGGTGFSLNYDTNNNNHRSHTNHSPNTQTGRCSCSIDVYKVGGSATEIPAERILQE